MLNLLGLTVAMGIGFSLMIGGPSLAGRFLRSIFRTLVTNPLRSLLRYCQRQAERLLRYIARQLARLIHAFFCWLGRMALRLVRMVWARFYTWLFSCPNYSQCHILRLNRAIILITKKENRKVLDETL